MTNKTLLIPLLLLLTNLQALEEKALPNDVRWVTQSKEYSSLCTQTYRLAAQILLPKLKNAGPGDALVMDLDETVLDNSKYQVERFRLNLGFTQESWSDWVGRREAGLVPGAKAFIEKVRMHRVKIVFLSNRMEYNLEPTRANLAKLGVLAKDDLFLLRRNKEDTKQVRREQILQGKGRMKKTGPLRVIAYFGDAMGDFPDEKEKRLGEKFFILPNPMYGKW